VIEGLADDGADRKLEGLGAVVLRPGAGWQPDRAQLVGIVAEQRRVERIGLDAVIQAQAPAIRGYQMPVAQFFRTALGMEGHARIAAPVARTAGQQRHQRRQEESPPLHDLDAALAAGGAPACVAPGSTIAGNAGNVQRTASPTRPGFLYLCGPSALSTPDAPSTQICGPWARCALT